MELTEKEAHCIARLLQGALFGEDILNGCKFCKFKCTTKGNYAPHLDALRKRLTDETGVDLRLGSEGSLLYSRFPYKRFLKNANAEIIDYFQKYFANLR